MPLFQQGADAFLQQFGAREILGAELLRRLIELAKSSTSLEEAAKQLGRSPDAIKRMSLRLGLSLKSKGTKKG